MLIQPDSRLKAALMDDNSARSLLFELHQQILNTRDSKLLSVLLGKYLATAAGRVASPVPLRSAVMTEFPRFQPQSGSQTETRKFTTISNVCKTAHDVAMNCITNVR